MREEGTIGKYEVLGGRGRHGNEWDLKRKEGWQDERELGSRCLSVLIAHRLRGLVYKIHIHDTCYFMIIQIIHRQFLHS